MSSTMAIIYTRDVLEAEHGIVNCRWSTGEETTEAFDNLKMTKKAPSGHDPLVRKVTILRHTWETG